MLLSYKTMEEKKKADYCRFYGKNRKDKDAEYISAWEDAWLRDSISEADFLTIANEYIASGLTDFEKADGTPMSLKVILFNRYSYHTGLPMLESVDGFKDWYLKVYMA